ncbi:MAG: hypothetical protein IT381_20640 [Deltaproteobacteria bacterium]|nr:hypothetical protein [Deltaproteobacteria bacterium]
MGVLIALLLVGALSLQDRLDAARAAEAAGHALAASERAFLALARCTAIPDEPALLPYRIEQARRHRLSAAEREATVWRELDHLRFSTNAPPSAVLWPRERETWRSEEPYRASEERKCDEQPPMTLSEELSLVEAAMAIGKASVSLKVHAAVLAHRLGRPLPAIAPGSDALSRLLAAERVASSTHATKDELAGAIAIYRALQKEGVEPNAARVREIVLALRGGDPEAIGLALRDDPDGEIGAYAFAWRLLRLRKEPDRVLAEAVRYWPKLRTPHYRALIDDLVRDALSLRPFDATTLATLTALYGRVALDRQVYRLATLALSRGRTEQARAALLWVVSRTGAEGDRTSLLAQRKLGVAALLLGDTAMLTAAARALELDEAQFYAAIDEWMLAARTAALAKPETLQPLLAILQARPKGDERGKTTLGELKDLLAHKPVKVWKVALDADDGAVPEPPEVAIALPEVYSVF